MGTKLQAKLVSLREQFQRTLEEEMAVSRDEAKRRTEEKMASDRAEHKVCKCVPCLWKEYTRCWLLCCWLQGSSMPRYKLDSLRVDIQFCWSVCCGACEPEMKLL
jgi:hypothetical protein